MRQVTEVEVKKRFYLDNPWWNTDETYTTGFKHKRAYFDGLLSLLTEKDINRAIVLMGPRRVGKTVLLKQIIEGLITNKKNDARNILYLSLDNPLYSDISLEKLFTYFLEEQNLSTDDAAFIFYDEIQYLPKWEIHLKTLVDSFPNVQFCVSGSAAAALKLKSNESGAGRFTDFLLPPLSFFEYCNFKNFVPMLSGPDNPSQNIGESNEKFIDYINYGGFPEAVFSDSIKKNYQRFIGQDVLDKILLRDLPALFGIADPQELNRFFATIAYNSGEEFSYENLSKSSGVAKNTIKKYLEFLEAAFLIKIIKRVDDTMRQFKRTTQFKIYLTNPSIRTALFGPVDPDEDIFGKLVETAVFCQYMHNCAISNTFYARWKGGKGEIDLVSIDPSTQKPLELIEIKWSDRVADNIGGIKPLITASKKSNVESTLVLTKTHFQNTTISDINITFIPVAEYCYFTGKIYIKLPFLLGLHPSSATVTDPTRYKAFLQQKTP